MSLGHMIRRDINEEWITIYILLDDFDKEICNTIEDFSWLYFPNEILNTVIITIIIIIQYN